MASKHSAVIEVQVDRKGNFSFQEFGKEVEGVEKKGATSFGGFSKAAAVGGAALAALAVQAGATAAALFRTAADVARSGDELQKMSLRTGVNIETLSKLKFAANLAGTDINVMEVALRKAQRSMLEASQGTAEYKEAFDAMGISVVDGSGKLRNVEDLLPEVADKLSGLSSETEKAARLQEIFGRSGTALLPLLRQGSQAIREQFDEAERLGAVYTELSANQSAEFIDAQERISTAYQGVKRVFAQEFMPVLTDGMNQLAKFLASGREQAKTWGAQVARVLRDNREQIVAAGRALAENLLPFLEKALALGLKTIEWAAALAPHIDTLAIAFSTLFVVNKLTAWIAAIGSLAPVIGTVIGVLSGPVGWIALLAGAVAAIKPLREAVVWLAGVIKDAAVKQFDLFREALSKWGQIMDTARTKLNAWLPDWAQIPGAVDEASGAIADLSVGLARMGTRIGETHPVSTKFADHLKNQLAVAEKAAAAEAAKLRAEVEAMPGYFLGAYPPVANAKQIMEEYAASARSAGEASREVNFSTEQLGLTFPRITPEVQDASYAVLDLGLAYDQGQAAQEALARSTDVWALANENATGATDDAAGSVRNLSAEIAQFARQALDVLGNLFDVKIPAWASAGTNAVLGFLDTIGNPTSWQDWVKIGISAASALIGALKGLFSKTTASDIAGQWGLNLSEALTAQIQKLGDSLGRDYIAAIRLSLDQVIKEMGVATLSAFQNFTTMVHQTLSSLDEGVFSATQTISAMADSILALIPSMDAVGASAMDFQSIFSDLVTRARNGTLDLDQVMGLLQSSIQAMSDAGVDGVQELIDWLATLGITIDGVVAAGHHAWRAFADGMGVAFQYGAELSRKELWELARQMGLSQEAAREFVRKSLEKQRADRKEADKEARDIFRQQADELGLSEDAKKEFVKANMKLRRQEIRDAEKEERDKRRETETEVIESGRRQRDAMKRQAQAIKDAWLGMYRDIGAAAAAWSGAAFTATPGFAGPSFQTEPGQFRVVPGPPNRGVMAMVHGQEVIGRPSGGGFSGGGTVQNFYFSPTVVATGSALADRRAARRAAQQTDVELMRIVSSVRR